MRNNRSHLMLDRRSVTGAMPLLRLLLTLAILVLGLPTIAAPATALAQGACGDTVTVVYGDTLREIAARCNTTVAEILALNPAITNRNLIRVGQVINLPNAGVPTPSVADLTIQPNSGPSGTVLTVTGRNYPATTEVIVGIGEPESEPATSIRAMSSADGTLRTQVTVPADAQANQRFVVVAYMPGQEGARATSPEFITTGSQESPGTVTIYPQVSI